MGAVPPAGVLMLAIAGAEQPSLCWRTCFQKASLGAETGQEPTQEEPAACLHS